MSRTFAVFLILAAAGCGGGGEAGGADEGSGLLSFEQPAEGVPFTTGPVPFRLDFEPLELAFETLEVTLDGQLQEGPFLFSSSQILVTVLVEEPGDHLVEVSILARLSAEDEFTEESVALPFTTVAGIPNPGLPLRYTQLGAGPIAQFGLATVAIEDVDEDGFEDFLVGSPRSSAGLLFGGLVELRSGQDGSVVRSWTGPEFSEFGAALAVVPDLDGDGVSDLAVGAPGDSTEFFEAGGVTLFSVVSGQELWHYSGEATRERAGFALSAIDDLDGDGVGEVIVGSAFSETENGFNTGSIRVLSGADGAVLLRRSGPEPGVQFGVSVGALDDLDGDGLADLAVGSWGDRDAGPSAGAVYAVSGATGDTIWKTLGLIPDDHLGRNLAVVADFDGDGFRDLVVGAPEALRAGLVGVGEVRVLSGFEGGDLLTLGGIAAEERFGQQVVPLEDWNGDGVGEWGLAAPFQFNYVGRVQIHDGATGEELHRLEGPPTIGLFGTSLTSLGDQDGNGVPELIVGAPFESGEDVELLGSVRVFGGVTEAILEASVLGWDAEGQTRMRLVARIPERLAGQAFLLVGKQDGVTTVLATGQIPRSLVLAWEMPQGEDSQGNSELSFVVQDPGGGVIRSAALKWGAPPFGG